MSEALSTPSSETGTTAGAVTGALIGGLISRRALYLIFGPVDAYSAYMLRKHNVTAGQTMGGRWAG